MKAVGTNTAVSTSAIATRAPPTSLHGLVRGGRRREAVGDLALDVLDDHDGVVDDDADGEDEAEQSQVVEREAERRHDGERADERHRDGDDRDDGRAPGLQEDDDDENHERDRLEQGHIDFVDRVLDEGRRVVDDAVFEPRREIALERSPSTR